MADNLDVSIGIDTKKLAADLAVAQSLYKKTLQEMKKAGDEFARTGDRTRVDKLSAAADTLKKAIFGQQATINAANRVLSSHAQQAANAAAGIHKLSQAHRELAEEGKGTSREVFTLSKELGKMETSGLAVAKAFKEVPQIAVPIAIISGAALGMKKLADEAANIARTIDDLHDVSGRPTADILALRRAFIDVNGEAKDADSWVRKMAEDFTKAHENAQGLETAFSGGISVMRGGQPSPTGGITVMRGGQQQGSGFVAGGGGAPVFVQRGGEPFKLDVEHGLGGLLPQAQFPLTDKGRARWEEQSLKILAELEKTQHQFALRVAATEMPGVKPEVALSELLGRAVQQAMEHAGEVGTRPPPEDLRPGLGQMATGLQISEKRAGEAAEGLTLQKGSELMTGVTNVTNAVTSSLESSAAQMRTTEENWAQVNERIRKDWDQTKTDIQIAPEGGLPTQGFETSWTDTFKGIAQAWDQLRNYMFANPLPAPSATGTIPPAATAQATPYATGGVVSGVGSGDTVPAWLTPGEYVNRRSSVAYYGSSIFQALNNRSIPRDYFSRIGYAAGGMVGGTASFADGGMVGGGTPVHLHLDGQQYAMTASENVATALVASARRHQMRSAGVKPSWYGGRPGA